MIKVNVPGKLYIAGEYAVVEPNHLALIVAVNRFITVTIKKSKTGKIISKHFSNLKWERKNGQLVFSNQDNKAAFVICAFKLIEKLAILKKKKLKNFTLEIKSQLDSSSGKKYGLGSSAAVTVAIIKAMGQFYELNLSNEEIFKLSSLSHLSIQGNGSLGDIAASVYQGWIFYSSFDKEWLYREEKKLSLIKLLKINWKDLKITPVTPPKNLHLLVGWSKKPASTKKILQNINKDAYYQNFLKESNICLLKLKSAFFKQDFNLIKKQLKINRLLLKNLSLHNKFILETSELKTLISIAEKFSACAKTSGAGGGDCGIALTSSETLVSKIQNSWLANGIEPLNLKVTNKGEIL